MDKYSVKYGEKMIEFEVERKNVENINLKVKPDMTVVVSANSKVPLDYILNFVRQKAPWIMKNIGYFKDVQPEYKLVKEYVSGESFKYLGKQYRLKVEGSLEESVRYYQGFIELTVKNKKDAVRKKKLIDKWYREKAVKKFSESLKRIYPLVQNYGIQYPQIQIKTMKARWGSCLEDKNTIVLNRELIKAPKFCIDYVVLHELVHFKYRNHDAEFYNFMTSLMPDWKQRKEILDEEVVREL